MLLCAAGCGGKVASVSQPVTITPPSAKASSTTSGTLSVSKDVSTSSGNPFGAFVTSAQSQLGGNNPSRITVASLTLSLLGTSTGVTALEQVFATTGPVTVSFLMNSSGNAYPVGSVQGPTGAGPVNLTASFDSNAMKPGDYQLLLGGQFKVVLAGPATSSFASSTSTADTQLVFGFVAYQ